MAPVTGGRRLFGQRYLELVLARERLVLALLAMLTLVLGWSALRVPLRTDFSSLYPPRHPYIELYREHREMLGSANLLTLALRVSAGTIFDVETIARIDHVTQQLLAMPGVDPTQVLSLTHPRLKQVRISVTGIEIEPVVAVLPRGREDVERIRATVDANSGIRGVAVSSDARAAAIYAGFWEEGTDLGDLFRRIEKLRAEVEDDRHELLVTGYPMLYAWIAHYRQALVLILLATAAAIGILLRLDLGDTRSVAIPLVSGLTSAVWAIGFAGFCGFSLDPLALVVFVLLTARALSHSVQSVARYREELAARGEPATALRRSYQALFAPALVAIISDGLAILTLALASIPLVQRIAVVSAFWIVSIVASVLTLHPILLRRLGDARAESPARSPGRQLERMTEACVRLSTGHGRIVVAAASAGLVLAGILFAERLDIGEGSIGEALLYDDHVYNRAYRFFNREFAGSAELVVVAEGAAPGALRDRAALESLDGMRRALVAAPEAGGARTITDAIRRVFRQYHEGEPRWEILPRDADHLGQILFLIQSAASRGELDRLVSPDLRNASVTVHYRDSSRAVVADAIARAGRYAADHPDGPLRFRLAGGLFGILAAVEEEVAWSRRVNLLLILVVVFALSALTYRSALAATIVMLPSLVAQPLSEALMTLAGIDLNVNSLPVAAVGIGIGIDYGYYVLSRIREEIHASGDVDGGIAAALRSTGRATLFTGATLLASVVFWIAFPMKFQAEMALLLAFVLIVHLVGALILIPTAVSLLRPRFVLPSQRNAA